MTNDFDPLDDIIERLVRLRERCGPQLYGRAAYAARAAIGRVVLDEAERRARGPRSRPTNVLPFPGVRVPTAN